jgi:Peptidase family M28
MHERQRPVRRSQPELTPANVLVGLASFAVLASLLLLALWPDDDHSSSTIGVATVDLGIGQSVVSTESVTAALTTPTAPGSTPEIVACTDVCLVRLAGGKIASGIFDTSERHQAYVGADLIWAGATKKAISSLQAEGIAAKVVEDNADTLRLYVVRPPAEMPAPQRDSLLRDFGQILDEADGQYLVKTPSAPASVLTLTNAGISVVKLPPILPTTPRNTDNLPKLVDSPDLTHKVSQSEIEKTILDLQGMSSTDGSGHGTRFFPSTGNAMTTEYLARRFAEYGAKVWYEDFVSRDGKGTLGINVVAELPGRDDSAVYLFTAHYDSIAEDTGGDQSTAPGALDNGTGISTLLEIARVLSGYDLKHPVRFAAFNGEEVGLQGSDAFASKAAADKTPYDAASNVDSVGAAYGQRRLVINADDASTLIQTLIAETHNAYGFDLNLDLRQSSTIVADDTPLSLAGIPTVGMGSVLFGDPLINQSHDTIDGVDLPYTTDVAALLVLCVAQLVGG